MSDKPQVLINWKAVGGRKFVAAFITFATAITGALAGNIDINTLILAVTGFITFIVIEGIIDFKGVANGNNAPKATMSGELKKKLSTLEEMLRNVKYSATKPEELPDTKPPVDED